MIYGSDNPIGDDVVKSFPLRWFATRFLQITFPFWAAIAGVMLAMALPMFLVAPAPSYGLFDYRSPLTLGGVAAGFVAVAGWLRRDRYR